MSNEQAPAAEWQGWVAEQLGLPAEATDVEMRAAILAKLNAVEFLPSDQLRAALRLGLAGLQPGDPPRRAMATFARMRRQATAEAVEEFAQRYWSLSPEARRQTHAQLLARAASIPLIRVRLEGLREGLQARTITAPERRPADVLGVMVQECYVLPPMDRAVRRQELIAFVCSDGGGACALEELETVYPHLAQLEPKLTARALLPPAKMPLRRIRRYDDVVPAGNHGLEPWKVKGVWIIVFLVISVALHLAAKPSGSLNTYPDYRSMRGYDVLRIPMIPGTDKPIEPIEEPSQGDQMERIFEKLRKSAEKAANSPEKMDKNPPGPNRPPEQGKQAPGDTRDSSSSNSPPIKRS